MTDYLNTRYEKDPSMVYRQIGGEAVLVPIRQNVADMDSIYTLTGVGAFIWGYLDGMLTLEELRNAIVTEYDVGIEQAETDLFEFIEQLTEIGAVRAR